MKQKYITPSISVSGTAVSNRLFALSLIQQPTVTFKEVTFDVVNDKTKKEDPTSGGWDENWLN